MVVIRYRIKKILEGEGQWDIRKEILGWVFDGIRRCIGLPPENLDYLIREVKGTLRCPFIHYKRFEKLVSWLRHAAIGLPVGKGMCAPLNRVTFMHPKLVRLHKHGAVYAAFLNWKFLLMDIKFRPTHVNELVGQPISYVGNTDASGIGAGGVWMSTSGTYHNIVWRVEWPTDISQSVVSDKNLTSSINNSDLEMAAIFLQWLVLEMIAPMYHISALARSDNSPACSWATCISLKSAIVARLVWVLALHQRIC